MASDWRLRSFLISQLRYIFRRYPPFFRTLAKAKEVYYEPTKAGGQRKRVRFTCSICKKKVSQKEIRIDHIDPVVPVTGFPLLEDGTDDFNTYIKRMFCEEKNLQSICSPCHDPKTKKEAKARREAKKKLTNNKN